MEIYVIINFGGNMKRILIFIATILCLALPLNAKAVSVDNYNTLNLEEALKAEKIEPEFDEYVENDDQVIIYVFRGQGCQFCRGFLNFINGIYEDEGEKFRIVSFETWNDATNATLLVDTAEFMGVEEPEKTGVPFIIIGDKYFPGFTEERYGDAVLEAIDEEYAKDKEDRYDIFEAMTYGKPVSKNTSSGLKIGGVIIIAVVAVGIVIVYDTIRFNKLQDEISKLNKKNK